MTREPSGYDSLKAATQGYVFSGFGEVGQRQWAEIVTKCREVRALEDLYARGQTVLAREPGSTATTSGG